MHTRTVVALCLVVMLGLALSQSVQVQPAAAEDTSQPKIMPTPAELGKNVPFKAVISASTITVGQSAVVTFTGAQLDVAGGNIIDSIGSEFASIVEVAPAGKAKFTVKGLAPGKAVLKFRNGEKEATVAVKVVAK